MLDYSLPIQTKGRFRVVALTEDNEGQDEKIIAYAVLDAEGARLFHSLSLDETLTWMNMQLDDEDLEAEKSKLANKPRRTRR
jgi:hypothetical protein